MIIEYIQKRGGQRRMHALRLWLTTLAARNLHSLCERADGALHGMCGAGQLLKSFRADCSAPITGGNLAL